MKKLLLSIFTCFGLIVLVGSQETKAAVNGVIPEEIKMTATEKAEGDRINAIIKKRRQYKDGLLTAHKWSRVAVPHYKQINDWYCGPATTAQTIRFYNKKAQLTQTTLGKELGTTTNGTAYSSIKKVLNSRSFIKKKYGFYNVTGKHKELIGEWLAYSAQTGRPVVLNIAIFSGNKTSKRDLGYVSSGHFLNSTGVYGDPLHSGPGTVDKIEVTDPFNYIGNAKNSKNNSTGRVSTTPGVMKTVIDNQPAATKNILW